ncbi:hypothetical protein V4C85_21790 [Ralstonia solanacearum]|nr:hypothetical protein [Ralstonia solanacearum]
MLAFVGIVEVDGLRIERVNRGSARTSTAIAPARAQIEQLAVFL